MPYKNKKQLYEAQKRYRQRELQRQRALEKALGINEVRRAIQQSNKELFDMIYGKKRKGKH